MHARIVFVLTCVFTIIAGISVVFGEPEEPPKVTLPHGGVLVGSFMKTFNGRTVRAFRGIPYAKPPIGELRFKPPLPYGPWTGEKLANKDGDKCPQKKRDKPISEWVVNEDCLFLNVYTTENRTADKPMSVMLFIHGGSWLISQGDSVLYGPERLLDHDIVLVTCNYRLGALGFLSTGTEDCPGNNGLKDQILVMKWIQENIGQFGGNPNDVTLFGESAGGASIAYHMYSDLSKGLFHKGILQSGTLFDSWASTDKAVTRKRTKKLGQLLSCGGDDENWQKMLKCLRTKTTIEIVGTILKFHEFDFDPLTAFPPVVEPDSEGAFLSRSPKETPIPPSAEIPIMIGVTADEGLLKASRLVNFNQTEMKSRFDELLAIILMYHHKPREVQRELTAKLKDVYLSGKADWNTDHFQNLTDLFSDGWFYAGMDRFLRERFAVAEKTRIGPTYVYQINHVGPFSMTQTWFHHPKYYGVCHMDDLFYLFPFGIDPKVWSSKANERDIAMATAMSQMWANFARFGNPTPYESELPHWKPATKFPLEYASLGGKNSENWALLTNKVGLVEGRMQFWRELEPVLENSF